MGGRSRSLVALVCLLLAGCGGGDDESEQRDNAGVMLGTSPIRGTMVRGGFDANRAYSQGVDFKAKGDCKNAVIRLRIPAGLGPGYENAQTALGECLLQVAGAGAVSGDYFEGVTWLQRAADAGWPEAQADLAGAYVNGPSTFRNGGEAAYWLALYDGNSGKSRVGFIAPDPAAIAALRTKITPAQKTEGERRAAQWQRKVWLPPAPAPGQPRGPGLDGRDIPLQQGPGGQRGPGLAPG